MEKINIAELLKDCPKGMELDCTTWENVTFEKVSNDLIYIKRNNKTHSFDNIAVLNKYGRCTNHEDEKCRIFPKGKTTWEGFVPPCKFNDGDIISDSLGTCIFKGEGVIEGTVNYYCGICDNCFVVKNNKCNPDAHYGNIVDYRLATEKEKQKLFDAIKTNGYKWNAETKTLEELPRFKVGDRIKHIVGKEEIATVVSVKESHYNLNSKVGTSSFSISLQHEWELLPNKFDITTLVPFESKVLVRDTDHYEWEGAVFGRYDGNSFFTIGGVDWKYCIPYEGNEHLFGTTNDCDEYYKTWEK